MATRLQNLLGILPLQNLSRRNNPTQQSNLMRQNLFGMETPINTDLQNQVGIQPVQPLAPMTQQIQPLAPIAQQTPNYFNQQMINTGLDNNFTSSFTPESSPTMSRQLPTYGNAMKSVPVPSVLEPEAPYQTGQAQLFESFFSGIGGEYGQQLTDFTADTSAGGVNLSIGELARLAGFDVDKLEDYQKEKLFSQLRAAGIMQYEEQFANLDSQLRNTAEFRTMSLTEQQEAGSEAYKSLLGFTEAGSISGIESGREQARQQEATKDLEDAMKKQLLGAEASYVRELDALLQDFTGGFQSNLFGVAADAIQADPELGGYVVAGAGTLGDEFITNYADIESQYIQVYTSQNIPQGLFEEFKQDKIAPYYNMNGYYPDIETFTKMLLDWYATYQESGTEGTGEAA